MAAIMSKERKQWKEWKALHREREREREKQSEREWRKRKGKFGIWGRERERERDEREREGVWEGVTRGVLWLVEWFGVQQHTATPTTKTSTPTPTHIHTLSLSLSLLPCQSVTPSYDPGESVFVCFSL